MIEFPDTGEAGGGTVRREGMGGSLLMSQLTHVSFFAWSFLVLLSIGCAALVSHFLVYLLSFLSFLRFLFLVV